MIQNLFIGTYSKNGVYKFNFNNGILTKLIEENSFENCSYLCLNNNSLYSIVEYSNIPILKNGYVASRNLNLTPTSTTSLMGNGPCFITTNENANMLYIGNYGDGSIDVFSLTRTGTIASLIHHKTPYSPNSKIHYIDASYNNFLFAVDLGTDTLFAYEILLNGNSFELKNFSTYHFPTNSAPRHLVRNNNTFYIITENSCELYKLNFSKENGFTFIDSTSLLPANIILEKNYTGCAIKISKDKNFIYTSIRGHNSISVFEINNSLNLIQNIACSGITPRDLWLDNSQSFLLCANQDSNNINIFNRDIKTGYLHFKSIYPITSPACII